MNFHIRDLSLASLSSFCKIIDHSNNNAGNIPQVKLFVADRSEHILFRINWTIPTIKTIV